MKEVPPAGDVSAVIVSYNVRDLLLQCIASLRADGVEHIVVVDNASKDGSAEAARRADPAVDVVALDENLGFGSGANRGVVRTSTPYVVILNPDLEVEPGATKALVDVLERLPDVGIVAPRIETPDGRLYPSARTFPDMVDAAGHAFLHFVWRSNPFSRRYKMLDWDHEVASDVDWVAGTHLVVRRTAWDEVGGFDEGFFMYLEDVDLCWRLGRAGWRVRYEPAARVVHAIGRSTDQTPYRMIAEHHRSLLRYAGKTTTGPRRLLLPVIAAALALRTVLAWAQRAWRGKPHAAH
ncbi:MAG: dTDP-Rha:A-D-GlcNAc-diphosphoryl polyprenol, A-3-L-rhamnosyl transferase WbbL [Actinomycetia bacterium]|nr:dTDP-Rha:A-D-GlcNAc-diphosphoryl polyprenol, A-3-L-rhamnosyl transferase WbbL [Actinomycetes bacterium]